MPSCGSPFEIDSSPTWSHDSRQVAYVRQAPSQDGPAGVYAVPSAGGSPRLIRAATGALPLSLGFSADDRYLAMSTGQDLLVIDAASGADVAALHSHNYAVRPDWSPTGHLIAYERLFWYTSESLDSAGVHIFDPTTGADHAIYHDSDVVFGANPRWTPDGSKIACFTRAPIVNAIFTCSPDGATLDTLTATASSYPLSNLHWYGRASTNRHGFVFIDAVRGTFFVSASGGPALPWRPLGSNDDYSPSGAEVVSVRSDPHTCAGVLFVDEISDLSGGASRQLTVWAPPTPSTRAAVASSNVGGFGPASIDNY